MDTQHPPVKDHLDFHVHRLRRGVIIRAIGFLSLSLVGLLLSASALVWQWESTITQFGPAVLLRWMLIPALATLIFIILTSLSFLHYQRTRQREVQLSETGLTVQRGKSLLPLKWDDVSSIRTNFEHYGILGITWAKKKEISLTSDNGGVIKFDQSYEHIDELIEEIKLSVYPKLFEMNRLAFNRGEPLSFGPLVLTSNGILNGRKALRWKDLESIRLDSGMLKLRPFKDSKSSNLSIPTNRIPNLDLCLQLINHLSPQA